MRLESQHVRSLRNADVRRTKCCDTWKRAALFFAFLNFFGRMRFSSNTQSGQIFKSEVCTLAGRSVRSFFYKCCTRGVCVDAVLVLMKLVQSLFIISMTSCMAVRPSLAQLSM